MIKNCREWLEMLTFQEQDWIKLKLDLVKDKSNLD